MLPPTWLLVWVSLLDPNLPTLGVAGTTKDKAWCEWFAGIFNEGRGKIAKGHFACIPAEVERNEDD